VKNEIWCWSDNSEASFEKGRTAVRKSSQGEYAQRSDSVVKNLNKRKGGGRRDLRNETEKKENASRVGKRSIARGGAYRGARRSKFF